MDQIKDNTKLAEEHTVLDDHEDKVEDMTERCEDLVKTTEHVIPHVSDMGDYYRLVLSSITEPEHLSRRLSQAQDSFTKQERIVEVKEKDKCLLAGHEKTEGYRHRLAGNKKDLLLIDNYECLAGNAGSWEEASARSSHQAPVQEHQVWKEV